MPRPRAGQIRQVMQQKAGIRAGGHGDPRFFANLRQGEWPMIFEKAGIGHDVPYDLL